MVFALDMLDVSPPPLSLLLDAQRLALYAHNPRSAGEQSLVEIIHLLSLVRGSLYGLWGLERIVSRSNVCGAVETQDIAGPDVGHLEREAEGIAAGEEIGPAMQMCGYVVCWLCL